MKEGESSLKGSGEMWLGRDPGLWCEWQKQKLSPLKPPGMLCVYVTLYSNYKAVGLKGFCVD